MWTKGLDARRIARICRVPYRKVYDHIRTRVKHNPDLFGQRLVLHDHPQVPRWGLSSRRPTWRERVDELVEFRRVHGRLPRGYIQDESKLYTFLQYQREKCRGGKLPSEQNSYLDEKLPGWLTPPKNVREKELWRKRAAELDIFLQRHGHFPSYKIARESAERVLATWVTRQRQLQRIGQLDPDRLKRLDSISPAWRTEQTLP